MSDDIVTFDVDLVDEGDISVDVESIYIPGGGGIFPSGTMDISSNGVYDITNYAEVDVDVQGGVTPTGTKSISSNGVHDVTNYASANVNVPNSYSQSDEGKVVSSGALVAQTSQTVTENGIYNTTLKNSVTVNVPSSGGGATTIASGTFVGDNTQFATVAIGKKMAQTDFFIKIKPQANSEYPYDTNYKFANIALIVFSGFAHFDLSTDGEKKTATSDLSYSVNNSGTITNVVVGDTIALASNIRNTSGTKNAGINQFKITKSSFGFSIYLGHSNALYKFLSTVTFDWEIVYFGSNPSTDIVEVA